MNETQLKTVAQLRAFLNGTLAVEFQPIGWDSLRYEHIAAVLRLCYRRLSRSDKGMVLHSLERTTGYSSATDPVGAPWPRRGGARQALCATAGGCSPQFTPADVALLAETDALHGALSGPATKHLMQRSRAVFRDDRYERLATLFVAHLYNLRHEAGYQARQRHWTKTRGHSVPIAERPAPDGSPTSSASTPSIREMRTASRDSNISMPSTV